MLRLLVILLGGIVGAIAGVGVAFASAMVLFGSDDKGWMMIHHMVPITGILMGIIGFTVGATWTADLTDPKER